MKKYKIDISSERHNRDLESLGSIFIPLVEGAVSSDDLIGVEITLHWEDIIGKDIYNFSTPKQTKFDPKANKRTLYIDVPVGGFALELQHKENYILNKVNAYFGYNAVHKLNINQNMNMLPKKIVSDVSRDQKKELTPDEEKYLQEVLQEIKDEKLREILTNLGKSIMTNKKE